MVEDVLGRDSLVPKRDAQGNVLYSGEAGRPRPGPPRPLEKREGVPTVAGQRLTKLQEAIEGLREVMEKTIEFEGRPEDDLPKPITLLNITDFSTHL